MSNYDLIQFPDADSLAKAVAGEWLGELRARRSSAAYCQALSGGRIARLLFSALAALAKQEGFRFEEAHFFWADERCVPPTDPESNFAVARELLFGPLKIGADQIHRIRGEHAPAVAAREASGELQTLAGTNPEGTPALDLVLLGMGEDGHVASLFPGEPPELKADRAVYRSVVAAPKPPPQRVTLGYPPLAVARHVWVLASGPGKEKALRESLEPSGQTPLAEVLRSRKHTRIFSDIR